MRIVFMGSAGFAVPSLAALLQSDHQLLEVVVQPDKPAGRGQKTTASPVAQFAREQKLPLYQPPSLKTADVLDHFKVLAADLFVVVAYGKILPPALLDLPPRGAINVHASLLPKYRGAAPIQWALAHGETMTGVTTMYLAPEMDAGDIIMSCATKIDECEKAPELHDRLAEMGALLLLETMAAIAAGKVKRTPQDRTQATSAPIITKEDAHIDWSLSAFEIYNRIRAFTPWPGAFALLNGKRLQIHEAAPFGSPMTEKPGTVISSDKQMVIATGQGQLYLLEVQLEGKKRMSTAEFLRGHRIDVGTKLR